MREKLFLNICKYFIFYCGILEYYYILFFYIIFYITYTKYI